MKPDLILLPQLLPVKCKVSDSAYLSKTMAERTQSATLQHSYFTRLCSDAFGVWWETLIIHLS